MDTGFFGVAWWIWGAGCMIVAGIYSVVWPRPRVGNLLRGVWQAFVLRWFHALVWLLLAAACFVRYANAPAGVPETFALSALAAYLIFMGTFAAERTAQRRRAG